MSQEALFNPSTQRYQITRRGHPHYPEVGRLTGEIIKSTGQQIIELENCQHGTERSAVQKEEIKKI